MILHTVFWSVKTWALYSGANYLWNFSFLRKILGVAPFVQKRFVIRKWRYLVLPKGCFFCCLTGSCTLLGLNISHSCMSKDSGLRLTLHAIKKQLPCSTHSLIQSSCSTCCYSTNLITQSAYVGLCITSHHEFAVHSDLGLNREHRENWRHACW